MPKNTRTKAFYNYNEKFKFKKKRVDKLHWTSFEQHTTHKPTSDLFHFSRQKKKIIVSERLAHISPVYNKKIFYILCVVVSTLEFGEIKEKRKKLLKESQLKRVKKKSLNNTKTSLSLSLFQGGNEKYKYFIFNIFFALKLSHFFSTLFIFTLFTLILQRTKPEHNRQCELDPTFTLGLALSLICGFYPAPSEVNIIFHL